MKLFSLLLVASVLVWIEAAYNKDFKFCLNTKWAGDSPCFPSKCPRGWVILNDKYTNQGLKKHSPFAPAKCESSRRQLCCDPRPCPDEKRPSRPRRQTSQSEWDTIDATCLRWG